MECRASKRALMNGPPGPLPTHHLSFIGEILRSASCKPKTLSAAKLRFHQRRYFSHVGAPRELAFQCPHDFAHVGHAFGARLRDCCGNLLSNLGVGQLPGQVAREKIQLEGFAVDEVLRLAAWNCVMESRRCLIIFSITATTSASESSFLSSTSRCLIAASNKRMADSRCASLAFIAAFMSSLMLAFSDMRSVSSKVGILKTKRRDER